jgi:hypothetical protein
MTVSITNLRLRANPAYELVLYDRLPEADRRMLAPLESDPDCYGVLRPKENSGLSMKSISRDTALLLYSLQNPGPLPAYAARSLGDNCETVIGKMVLDGILEVEAKGGMISGPRTYSLIFKQKGASPPRDEGHLAAISRRALEYAAMLEIGDPTLLSARLYTYNTVAHSRRWRNLLPDAAACEAYLGLGQAVAANWVRLGDAPAWISWRAKNVPNRQAEESSATYKLYVSPACAYLRESVSVAATMAASSGAFHWKVGKDIHGLLRPDKLVFYFRQFADLERAATLMTTALEGIPGHGVPFTAALDDTGLLSWGIDPPVEQHSVLWLQRESWRLRICNRLALALIQVGKEDIGGMTAPQFAVERVRLDGIDTDTWTPDRTKVWSH